MQFTEEPRAIEYQYDPLRQLTQMEDWLGVTELELDPLGSVVHYGYDQLGRMTEVIDALGKTTEYKYDAVGNLKERVLPNGSKTEYNYDALYRITELKELDPARRITDKYLYNYDKAGNKISIDKARTDLDDDAIAGEEREIKYYEYDPLDQLVKVTGNNGDSKKYFYDTLGNRVRLEEWTGVEIKEAINYEYNRGNRLVSTYEDYIFTGSSEDYEAYVVQNAEILSEDNFKSYKYDNRGNLIEVASSGKIFNKYEFDPRNQLTKVINKHGDKTEYTYDGFGNRIQTIVDLDHPGGVNRPEPPNGNNGNGNNGNGNAYGHENGNNGNGNAYGHDKEHPGQGNAYGKDKNGNPKPGWDHQYKRREMELNYVVDITSAYNDVLMTYGDNYQVQRYTHGIDQISMDFWMLDDHDNGWIPGSSEMNLSGERQRLYYLHDELGSVTKVIGENGKTSAHYNYDEFGRPLPSVKFDQNWPGPDNTFGYTGYQYDASAELWYAQARYYMPEIGRFISEDPWSGTILTPTTMNPYPYVLNNPLKYVDPSGLQPESGWAGYTEFLSDAYFTDLDNLFKQIKKQNDKWYIFDGSKKIAAEAVINQMMDDLEGNMTALINHKNFNRFFETFDDNITKLDSITKRMHFFRNTLNEYSGAPDSLDDMIDLAASDKWKLFPNIGTAYHRYDYGDTNGALNVKFVSKNGRFEAVYNTGTGKIVKDPANMGTYNYAPGSANPKEFIEHDKYDVKPWKKWGNAEWFPYADIMSLEQRQNKEAEKNHGKVKEWIKQRKN